VTHFFLITFETFPLSQPNSSDILERLKEKYFFATIILHLFSSSEAFSQSESYSERETYMPTLILHNSIYILLKNVKYI